MAGKKAAINLGLVRDIMAGIKAEEETTTPSLPEGEGKRGLGALFSEKVSGSHGEAGSEGRGGRGGESSGGTAGDSQAQRGGVGTGERGAERRGGQGGGTPSEGRAESGGDSRDQRARETRGEQGGEQRANSPGDRIGEVDGVQHGESAPDTPEEFRGGPSGEPAREYGGAHRGGEQDDDTAGQVTDGKAVRRSGARRRRHDTPNATQESPTAPITSAAKPAEAEAYWPAGESQALPTEVLKRAADEAIRRLIDLRSVNRRGELVHSHSMYARDDVMRLADQMAEETGCTRALIMRLALDVYSECHKRYGLITMVRRSKAPAGVAAALKALANAQPQGAYTTGRFDQAQSALIKRLTEEIGSESEFWDAAVALLYAAFRGVEQPEHALVVHPKTRQEAR